MAERIVMYALIPNSVDLDKNVISNLDLPTLQHILALVKADQIANHIAEKESEHNNNRFYEYKYKGARWYCESLITTLEKLIKNGKDNYEVS